MFFRNPADFPIISEEYLRGLDMCVLKDRLERRNGVRLAVLVPASLIVGDKKHTSKLLNVVAEGALIETAANLPVHSRIQFRCGTIDVSAFVVWRNKERYGLRFLTPLSVGHLQEQVSRTSAVKAITRQVAASAKPLDAPGPAIVERRLST